MPGILAECPVCHRKQSVKNKICNAGCGVDLDREKKAKKVRYHIYYTVNGKQKREAVGAYEDLDAYSLDDAKDLLSDRRVKKRKKEAFHLPEYDEKTFKELQDWYLGLAVVKDAIKAIRITRIRLNNFSAVLGDKPLRDIVLSELDGYKVNRERDGVRPVTVRQESKEVKIVISRAFNDNLISASIYKTFKNWTVKVSESDRARRRTVSVQEYLALLKNAIAHLRGIIIVGYHTGMRPGEIKQLNWSHLDRKNKMILFPRVLTKEGANLREDSEEVKRIPINKYVEEVFKSLPIPIKGDGPVFTYAGRRISRFVALRTSLKTTCRKAGIPYGSKVKGGFVLKDLRKTFATNMESAGVQESHRKTIMGHSLQGMDPHYVQPTDADLQNAMDLYTAWFDEQLRTIDQIIDHQNASD